jgi:hypothetical protein
MSKADYDNLTAQGLERLRSRVSYDPATGNFVRMTRKGLKRDDLLAGTITYAGYVSISFWGKKYQAHRLAWLFTYGNWPVDELDHINGNRSDNRIVNLREATSTENKRNRVAKVGSSAFKGVYWEKTKRKWVARIKIASRTRHIGCFDKEEAAAKAYDAEAASCFGPFAYLNFGDTHAS